ncbi:Rab1a [Hexamita inflata]|uniref:Rab1a n=1 Tax=Hexamita inflata TaxID=28002 RepID=A0AA86PUV4_9EUKA|nr:Rab1a [Hexamita inflata]
MSKIENQHLLGTKPQISVTLVGSMGVGKSTLIQKLVYDQFVIEQKSTINPSCSKMNLNGMSIRLWDTAGQEQFRTFTFKYISRSHIVLIVCDSTDLQSIKDLNEWFEICDENKVGNQSRVIVATKMDLKQEDHLIDLVKNIATENKAKLIFCSSKNGSGINEITDLFEQTEVIESTKSVEYVEDEETQNEKISKGCCK